MYNTFSQKVSVTGVVIYIPPTSQHLKIKNTYPYYDLPTSCSKTANSLIYTVICC